MGNFVSALSYHLTDVGPHLLLLLEGGDEDDAIKELKEHNKLAGWYRFGDGQTPLHVASCYGQLKFIKELYRIVEAAGKEKAKGKKKKRREGRSAEKRQGPVKGTWWDRAFVNARNNKGQTPLMLACSQGHAKVVRYLLELGADPLLTDTPHGRVALHYAASASWVPCIDALLSDSSTWMVDQTEQRLRDVWVGDSNRRGCHRYVNAPDAYNTTPMHLVAASGHLRAAKCLLKLGGRIDDIADRVTIRPPAMGRRSQPTVYEGCTPLHVVAARGDCRMARVMLRAHATSPYAMSGDDVRGIRDSEGRRPCELPRVQDDARLSTLLEPSVPLTLALLAEIAAHRDLPWGPMSLACLAAASLQMHLLRQLDELDPRPDVPQRPPMAESASSRNTLSPRKLLRSPRSASPLQVCGRGCSPDHACGKSRKAGGVDADDEWVGQGPSPTGSATQKGAAAQDARAGAGAGQTRFGRELALSDAQSAAASSSAAAAAAAASAAEDANYCSGSSSSGSGSSCLICCDRDEDVAVRACGHRMCLRCARQMCVTTAVGKAPRCPFCRGSIGEFCK